MPITWFIALRYLLPRSQRGTLSLASGISIGGVATGVLVLILANGVMRGLDDTIEQLVVGASAPLSVSASQAGNFTEWAALRERVLRAEGVRGVRPVLQTEVGITRPGGAAGAVLLRGLGPERHGAPVGSDAILRAFATATPSGAPPLVLSRDAATALLVSPGDRVSLIAPRGKLSFGPGGLMPPVQEFEVVALTDVPPMVSKGMVGFTTLAAAQQLLAAPGAVSALEIDLQRESELGAVQARLRTLLGSRYEVRSWRDEHASLFSALTLERYAMGLILLLIVVVAGFNIAATLVMLVVGKTAEIGVLLALGLTAAGVRAIFMLQGLLIGGLGALLGLVGGLSIAWLQQRYGLVRLPPGSFLVEQLPIAVMASDVALVVGATLVVCTLAGVQPARAGARLEPVEAMRRG